MLNGLIDITFGGKHLDMTQHYSADGDIAEIDDVECDVPFELNINPKEIKLSIYSPNSLPIRPVKIVAKQRNCTLHFFKTRLVSSRYIGSQSGLRITTYSSKLMLATIGYDLPERFQGFKFEFDDFTEWYRESNCRSKIYSSILKSGDPGVDSELIGIINNEVRIIADHNPVWGEGKSWAGIKLRPRIAVLGLDQDLDDIMEYIGKFQRVLSFLCGRPIFPRRLSLTPHSSGMIDLYVIDTDRTAFERVESNVLFPITTADEYPSDIWSEYFNLSQHLAYGFDLFYKYQLLRDGPDKFLGLFRVLEIFASNYPKMIIDENTLNGALKKVRGLLEGIPGLDSKKRKFIVDFIKKANKFSTIEHRLNSLVADTETHLAMKYCIDKEFINRIVTTRNKITHAEPVSLNEYDFLIDIKAMRLWIYYLYLSHFKFEYTRIRDALWSGCDGQTVHLARSSYDQPLIT